MTAPLLTPPGVEPSADAVDLGPLTEAQDGLWYAQRLDPTNPIFNTGQFVEIEGPLDVSAFVAAVDQAPARSPCTSSMTATVPAS